MAAKKPLVLTGGQIQQLQSGDTLDAAVSEVDVYAATNNNAGSITIGQPVYVDAAGGCDLAQADAAATSEVFGLVSDVSVNAAASGNILTNGVLVATTAQWDTVTGGAGGLTAGTVYYLDASAAGGLTDTPPSSAGEFVVRVGLALSTTELMLSVEPPIKL